MKPTEAAQATSIGGTVNQLVTIMQKLLQLLFGSIEKVSQNENEDVAFAAIYSMFLSFSLTLLVVLIIAL